MNTCWKHQGGGQAGDPVRVCRFGFYHVHEVVYFQRRSPGVLRVCRKPGCSLQLEGATLKTDRGSSEKVHPLYCPPDAPSGRIKKWLRKGKALVLPANASFVPRASLDAHSGSVGKVKVLRYHPDCGSSNPAAQVALRCNLDVQCTDRVHVFSVVRKVTRWRDKRRARSCGLIGGGIFDEDGDDVGLDQILEREGDEESFAEDVAAVPDEPECFEDGEELEQAFLRDEAAMFPFHEGPEDELRSTLEEDPDATTYASHFEAVEEELEVFLRPEDEAGALQDMSQQDVAKSVFAAFRKMFQDSANQAHYQADYSTKAGPSVGAELPEQAIGIERLRESEKEGREEARREGRLAEFLADAGRRTLIRLQTAANRTSLKKLPEMVFQMMFQHEC
jgi:predicted RNase H-like HicB family nuclease